MISELNKAWLAGLIDGEGCIAFMRRTDYVPKHRMEVRYDVKIAMACRETVECCYDLIADIVGEDLVKEVYEERRKVKRRRPLYRCEVSSKEGVYLLLTALLPYLRTKKIEARLCINYLNRARHYKRYRATDFDRRLAELATGIRNGCGEARAEAEELLSQVIPSQAEGSELSTSEGVETSSETIATNNQSHECPAPHLQHVEGEDIVRSSSESLSEGLNGPRPVN